MKNEADKRTNRLMGTGAGLFLSGLWFLLSVTFAFDHNTVITWLLSCLSGIVFLCVVVFGSAAAYKHRERIMLAGIGLFCSLVLLLIFAEVASRCNTAFTWSLVCVGGIMFLCAGVFAGAVAYKYSSEGLGVLTFLCICFVMVVGIVFSDRVLYPLRFQDLTTEFSGLYQQFLETGASDPSVVSEDDRDLHGKKIVWCRYDEKRDSLRILPLENAPHRAPQIGRHLFAQRKDEADFLVVQRDLREGVLLTVFHVSTKRVKSVRLMPWDTKTVTETVIPGPGGGVEYVNKKYGPIGLRYHLERALPTEAIKKYVESVIVD